MRRAWIAGRWLDPREVEPPPMDHSSGWKASAFTPEMGELILLRIACGETVKEICADPRMPSYATVFRWTHVHEDFGAAWRAVRYDLAEIVRAEDQEAAAARAKASRRPKASGRRSTFRACAAMRVCWAVEQGAAISEVLGRDDAPSAKAFYRWLRNSDWLREEYARASDFREFVVRETSTDMALGVGDPRDWPRVKRQAQAMEGRAGRMRPRKYAVRPRI